MHPQQRMRLSIATYITIAHPTYVARACSHACRYNRDTVQQLAETARRSIDMSDNAARPR
jgi:hypothetical protein